MDRERYLAELAVLKSRLPENIFRFCGMETSEPYIMMAAVTNSKNIYTLKIELGTFPMSVPKVFVTQMLKNKNGEDLDSCSASMHTLQSEHGWTRICHYGSASWNPYVSIYKIYVKCRLWLEMYEAHLRTGHLIDYYLNHQG